ncbi:MAG: 2-oxoacid:ferredoxin oxidoreductase subunit gamma [Planctomycetes bacterium]|nr:2-oxoacid:ferredoxin oxidoreductase subunit gamma [Planctomycetota bacterium]
MYHDLIISGFGGQGILITGRLLAHAAIAEGRHVTFLPSYGPIMRGGTANCTVVVSSKPIGSPIIRNPQSAILMNAPSAAGFEGRVKAGGLILYDSDLIDAERAGHGKQDQDTKKVFVPANTLAEEVGSGRVANMVMMGAFVGITQVIGIESAVRCLKEVVSEKYLDLIKADEAALRKGVEYARDHASV